MNVTLIQEPASQARAKLAEYRKAVHRSADDEYQQILTAYEAQAKGLPLIRLTEAFRLVPRDDKGRPRLAIARADRTQVRYRQNAHSPRAEFDSNVNRRGRVARDTILSVDVGSAPPRRPENREESWRDSLSGYALVPIVPPDVQRGHDLSKHFTLWEVEQWADSVIRSGPDVDPFLLKHLGGDLYAVVGQWDLTPIEQAILAGRALA